MKPLTNKEYVASNGSKCPFCGHTYITGGPVDIDGGTACQEITCQECHRSWYDEYQLTGYVEIDQ